MVEPISNRERAAFLRKLRFGFVTLVAVSAALVALWGGGSLVAIGGAAAGGALVGLALAWLALPDVDAGDSSRTRSRSRESGSRSRDRETGRDRG